MEVVHWRLVGLITELEVSIAPAGHPSQAAPLGGPDSRDEREVLHQEKPTSPRQSVSEEPPANFIRACKGDLAKAARRWALTRQWRQEHGIDSILERPHPNYETLKRVYPMSLAGRSLQGHVVVVERPGDIDLHLMRAQGLGPQDMVQQLALVHEFLWTVLLPGDEGRLVTLMDAKGLSLAKLASPDVLALIRATSDALNNHYPDKVAKILVVNAPRLFAPIFKLLSSVMPSGMREQFQICQSVADLERHVAPEVIPAEYGGRSAFPLGQAPDQLALDEVVAGAKRPQGSS